MLSTHGANVKQLCIKYNLNEDNITDFSSNINIFKPHINYELLAENISFSINRYPDIEYSELKENISHLYKIDKNYIQVGNGATELIYDLLLLDEFKNIGIFNPTFSEYERASLINKKNVIDLDINKIDQIDENTTIKDFKNLYLQENVNIPDILILCNPNNPTGIITNLQNLIKFCKKNNIFLLVDETFIDFMYNENFSLISNIKLYDNLIILNAITKFFAMTGARLGYTFCSNKDINRALEKIKKPWSINILAEEVVKQICNIDTDFYEKTKNYFTNESKRLYDKYSSIKNISITNSSAPFFTISIHDKNSQELQKKLLLEKNILIRTLNNYKNISKNSIRIAIKEQHMNDMLFDILSEYFNTKH
ncbi:pyridoxal phosphate-dependent aminotransferase [Peptoanaerobacter stomatis]